MKKNDILEKAQEENEDERETQINIRSYNIGWIGVSAVMVLLIILRAIHNESAYDIMMIFMAHNVVSLFYQYIKMPSKKVYLVAIIGGAIGFLLALLALLRQYGVF